MRNRLLFFVAAITAIGSVVVSCENPQVEEPTGKNVTIYATLENGRQWNAGDELVINGATFTASEGGSSTIKVDNVAEAENYYATYDFGSGSIEGTTLALELPAMQGTNLSKMQPMVASANTPNLVFKNVMGELVLNIEGKAPLRRLTVSSLDAALAGEGTIDLNFAGSPKLKLSDSGSRSVTYDAGEGVALPAEIAVALPLCHILWLCRNALWRRRRIMSGVEISATEILRGETTEVSIAYEPDAVPPTYVTATMEADAFGAAYAWNSSSVLYVNGTPVQVADAVKGEFGPVATAELYIASTSSTSVNGVSGTTMRVSLPTTQGVNAQYAAINPAVAKSTTNNLEFSYLAGVITIDVQGEHNLRKAILSGKNNRRLSGSGVVDMSTDTPRFSLGNDASKDVIFDCGTAGASLVGGLTLRFVVPLCGVYRGSYSYA